MVMQSKVVVRVFVYDSSQLYVRGVLLHQGALCKNTIYIVLFFYFTSFADAACKSILATVPALPDPNMSLAARYAKAAFWGGASKYTSAMKMVSATNLAWRSRLPGIRCDAR
jgi:hypothetical protein